MQSLTKESKPKRPIRFPGIIRDARTLGCSRISLYLSLTGKRPDLPGLKSRYEALKKAEASK